jgi:succinyl-diaminopimelate desuccinylase
MRPVDVTRTVQDTVSMVRIDSQNPGPLEGACGAWVRRRLAQAAVPVATVSVEEGRENVVATVRGRGSGPRLVLLGHLDTVPIGDGWSVEPLGGVIRDGRVYGRGSADMKSGLAVAINLMESLAQGSAPKTEVVLCATVDEEGPQMAGAHAIVASGLLRPDDQVLALEPTGLRLRLAQVGLRWLELSVRGRMAHAGRAHLGVDANQVVARIVDRLRARVADLPHEDDLLGRPLFTCGTIAGGVGVNLVPPSCVAQLDLRFVPPMTPDEVLGLVRDVADEAAAAFPGADVELRPLGPARPPVRAADDAHLVTRLRGAYEDVTGSELASGGADGHEAYTDASMIAALTGSTSCTVFGPGSSDRAHTADEYVEIDEIEVAARVLEKMVADW